jgi:hypothetical protein
MTTAPVKRPPDAPAESVEERFRRLAAAWHRNAEDNGYR